MLRNISGLFSIVLNICLLGYTALTINRFGIPHELKGYIIMIVMIVAPVLNIFFINYAKKHNGKAHKIRKGVFFSALLINGLLTVVAVYWIFAGILSQVQGRLLILMLIACIILSVNTVRLERKN
ncbi:hypothetical protein Q5705_07770 [Kosakonia sp. H02]|nr:hypothetical protein Q5705_07770 [Kosakonia sp. H02]